MIGPVAVDARRIDMHVHMVSNGSSRTGGWMRLTGWHRLLAGFMVRQLGLHPSILEGDLDALYAEKLRSLVQSSSLDAVVLLAHERVYDPNGSVRDDLGSMHVPNELVLKLAQEGPEFLAGVSIHPARADAIAELERSVAEGAVLMKCLPNCQNIDCSDNRYQRFWERMAELELPLLAHTGGEHTVPVVNEALADPKTLRLPLECGVNVIAAHCATRSGLFDRDYFDDWVEMVHKFPNCYGDISAMVSVNRCRHLRDCLRPDLSSRILHGSDFPVPVLGQRLWLKGWINWGDLRRIRQIDNPLERDWQFKSALGFPEETRLRAGKLLRLGSAGP